MRDTATDPELTAHATTRRALCRTADDQWSIDQHHGIRHEVFVQEQRLFHPSDRDEHDDDPATIKVLGLRGPEPVGAVRLYPLDVEGHLWQGDRLAVLPAFRHGSLGGSLVRFAVRTAGERGGERMVAMIQLANVRFFLALGWSLDGDVVDFHGRAHQPMAIALSPADG